MQIVAQDEENKETEIKFIKLCNGTVIKWHWFNGLMGDHCYKNINGEGVRTQERTEEDFDRLSGFLSRVLCGLQLLIYVLCNL